MEISRITKCLLVRGARIDAKLSETQIRCTLIIRIPDTNKSNELIKKFLELFEVRYEEPQDVVELDTFNTNTNLNNQPNQTARCSNNSGNSSKKSNKSVAHGRDMKSKAKDIRAMFAKIARKNVKEQNE